MAGSSPMSPCTPDYRRRGIARELVHAGLDVLRARGAPSAVLQVKHDNHGAVALYRQLGFYHVRTWDTWRRPAHLGALPVDFDRGENLDDLVELAGANDWRAVYDLARIARPTGLGWMRATTPGAFRPGLWGALGDYLSGKVEERYVVRGGGSGDALVAALTISMPLASAVDVLTLMVHPSQRGRLERPLLAYALRRLRGRRRAVAIEHPHDDTAGAAALEALGFVRRETLAVMRHDLR
ncbi:MAG: GNAT family N-acetyltransferase [Anaerolineae bacterium]|nr:GNAT family N-acetyltransferase [Anaerolineae bacterium]